MEVHAGKVFGEGMPDGNLSDAHGPLEAVYSRKCWFAHESRQQLQAAQAADPSTSNDESPDWREPETVDLEGVIGEGDGDNRGA